MTEQETNQYFKMSEQLRSTGLSYQEWDVIKELRKKSLISKGENPDDWDLGSTRCSKKFI